MAPTSQVTDSVLVQYGVKLSPPFPSGVSSYTVAWGAVDMLVISR